MDKRSCMAVTLAMALAGCGEVPEDGEITSEQSALSRDNIPAGGVIRNLGGYGPIINSWGLPTVAVTALDLNRVAPRIKATHAAIKGTGAESRFTRGFRWNTDDNTHVHWTPQGLSGSGDAYSAGTLGGRTWLVASWHYDDDSRARVSFADVSNIDNVTYRHVMLVEPVNTVFGSSFADIDIHVGGIVWYRNLLYVADTTGGIRVFDTASIKEVSIGYSIGRGLGTNNFYAWDHRYVLPQVARYAPSGGFSQRWSFLGLDRSREPHYLISGEYGYGNNAYWWPLETTFGWLSPLTTLVTPAVAATSPTGLLQGVHSARSPWSMTVWFSTTIGDPPATPDKLVRYTLGNPTATEYSWGNFPEGLTYMPQTGEMWTILEGQLGPLFSYDNRVVFGVARSTVSQ
jgi:hypothetical protein